MARWAKGVGVVSGLAVVGVCVAGACLPDLSTNLCGNGHIDGNESCDPGENANPGCSPICDILCPPASSDKWWIDPESNHCYFTTNVEQPFPYGSNPCGSAGAHVVTLVNDDETRDVVSNLDMAWPGSARFWVGLQRAGDAGPFAATSTFPEPGWDVPSNCAGCYLHGVTDGGVGDADGGASAGPPGDVVDEHLPGPTGGGTMAVLGPNAKAEVVCEREPVGSRSAPCFQDAGASPGGVPLCFGILATTKSYAYNPSPATAANAEAFCHGLSSHGSLVVLGSRSEREQVIYEMTQMPLLGTGVAVPQSFWIGLHSVIITRGHQTQTEWFWDDGVQESPTSTGSRPSVWGNAQPHPNTANDNAYINTATGAYDTGLAYSAVASGNAALQLPFVCTY